MSCGTCHVNGAGNAKFFMPKMSTRPGNFDTTGPLFNPKADNFVLDPVRIPSLRGARYLAPYGADGRMASLRDFVRNVIVNEFAGPEPSPVILDAIVAYIQDIDFLPNPSLGPGGRLVGKISESERRGEALFAKPFPHDPGMSCAGCHVPSGAFVDHQQHDVGSGGLVQDADACATPISTRRISMTAASTPTIRWWRISTGCSISACPRRTSRISSPISPRWATARCPMSTTAPAPR